MINCNKAIVEIHQIDFKSNYPSKNLIQKNND